ncbi:hypothetical protein SADUNF_Sadunf17G0111100 [Salix dunnii]|uniref:Phosphatidic acid phosphatase type 2/haloperoxidase domain-containing protein n=1 Tax=Salix dunnii TaxID=1413687 RepID=A0A835J6M9_9ROSI|nr:hypothetical protein SADUNF_Sadunf17G0111100 [Salix dunnii]
MVIPLPQPKEPNLFFYQYKMREVQMRGFQHGHAAHTVRSHGAAVAKTHMHDWLVLLLLVLIEVILYLTPPFYRYVGKDMMTDLKYPLLDNTVPVWTVPIYAFLLPVVIFLFVYYRRGDIYDLHHAILGLLFSILVTGVITDAIKNAVGRPRPDFFWRCFPDGKDVYDQLGNVICHGEESVIKEGHKRSFAGLGFLSLYLSGKLQAFDRSGHVAKLCIVFLPLLAACLVAISRVDDYWHHWQDVFAGGLLEASFSGQVVATFCYLQFFPPPYHPQGWGPYAYFRELEESSAYSQAADTVNAVNAEPMDSHVESKEDDGGGFLGLHLARDLTMPIEDVESGRRKQVACTRAHAYL